MKQNLEKKLVKKCLLNYNENLAAVLIFGSYNIGPFVNGSSDLDTIILLKESNDIDFKREGEDLTKSLKDLNVALHHFKTIENYKTHIYNKGSWSSWITVTCGSKIAYLTSEFERFRKDLKDNPIKKEKLIGYLEHKDKVDLSFDMEKISDWKRTKAIYSHIRRKLQVLNYYGGNELNFDYMDCLGGLKDLKERKKLEELGKSYEKREGINIDKTKQYISIARNLTKNVMESLNR